MALKVLDHADRISREREITSEMASELADKGFFRLLMPRSLDGEELAYPDYLRIVKAFAEVDASTAWCINQNNVIASLSAIIPMWVPIS